MRTFVSKQEVLLAVVLYRSGCRINTIASKLNRSRTCIHNILVRQKVSIRKDKYNRYPTNPGTMDPGPDDPSPEEIARVSAEIRSTWGPQEEQERRGDSPYEFPVYSSRLRAV